MDNIEYDFNSDGSVTMLKNGNQITSYNNQTLIIN